MASEASLLAKIDAARATVDRTKQHAKDARKVYRRRCYEAWQAGVNVTQLAQHVGTSWSRMSEILKQAKAESKGLES